MVITGQSKIKAYKQLTTNKITKARNTRVFGSKKLFVENNGSILRLIVKLFHSTIYQLYTQRSIAMHLKQNSYQLEIFSENPSISGS